MARDSNEAHMVTNGIDSRVRFPSCEIAKVVTKPDVSHDIEGEKHRPGGCIKRLSLVGFDLGNELLRLRYDTGFVDAEGYYLLFSIGLE